VDNAQVQLLTTDSVVKTITITPRQWQRLQARLEEDYGPSILLLRDRRRRELGFLDRRYWHKNSKGHACMDICLDFYDNGSKVWFLLKYSQYVRQQ
jgi:hypothetical protein